MELELGGYEGGCEFGIRSCTSTSTPDLRGDVMKLLAVLEEYKCKLAVEDRAAFLNIPYPPL